MTYKMIVKKSILRMFSLLGIGLLAFPLMAIDTTWVGGASGLWHDAANWSAGVPTTAADYVRFDKLVNVSITQDATVKVIYVQAPLVIDIAAGKTLTLSNGSSDILIVSGDLTIQGAGTLALGRGSATNPGNFSIAAGAITTIHTPIKGSGGNDTGLELTNPGTVVLTNPANEIRDATYLTAAGAVLYSVPDALGTHSIYFWSSGATCGYTGATDAEVTLPVTLRPARSTLANKSEAQLTFSGTMAPDSSGAKTLVMATDKVAGTTIISGTVQDGVGVVSLEATGGGTLVLAGTLAYSGTTLVQGTCRLQATSSTGQHTVASGASLQVGDGGTFANELLVLEGLSTLGLNADGASNYALDLPAISVAGKLARLHVPAATSSTVTIASITASQEGVLSIEAPQLGSAQNRILIADAEAGDLPQWIIVNGMYAAYDSVQGIIATEHAAQVSLRALGPDTIPDDAAAHVVIDQAGTAGGITLAAAHTTIDSLTQAHAADPATVDLQGGTLAANVFSITAEGNDLHLADGYVSAPAPVAPPAAGATLPNTLTSAPIAWYDLADESTLDLDAAQRITELRNKGSRGTLLDAVVPAGAVGPLYLPGMIKGQGVGFTDDVEPPRILETVNNIGISGDVPRTVFLVASRMPYTGNNFYALFMGTDNGNNRDFSLIERSGQTSLSNKGDDLNIAASPLGLNILTFTAGVDGIPNKVAAYRNGVFAGEKTLTLNTYDAPLLLFHRRDRSGSGTYGISGPGEIAEALVFDYTLPEAERAAVEEYLLRKWSVAAQRDSVSLLTENRSPTAQLRLDGVHDPYGGWSALSHVGLGELMLHDLTYLSGSLSWGSTPVQVDISEKRHGFIYGALTGSGAFAKTGAGALTVNTASPAFSGEVLITDGTLYQGARGSLGSGAVRISESGALDIRNNSNIVNNPVFVEGSGPDALGALRHSGATQQQSALSRLTLTDDATLYAKNRFDVRNGLFDFGGHNLTLEGGGAFGLARSTVANVGANTKVEVNDGTLVLHSVDLQGTSNNRVHAAEGAGVWLYEMSVPLDWSLWLQDQAYLRVNTGGAATDHNVWAGPVELREGMASFESEADGSATVTGKISGSGGLVKEGPGWLWLLNPANDYSGATVVDGGFLYAASRSVLGSGALRVNQGSLIARLGGASAVDCWTEQEVEALLTDEVFDTTGGASLGLDLIDGDVGITRDLPNIGLTKMGPYTLTVSGQTSALGALTVFDGTLDLSNTGGVYDLGANSIIVGGSTVPGDLAILRLENVTLKTEDMGYQEVGPRLEVGAASNARGVLVMEDGASVNGQLRLGSASASVGALYQEDGEVLNNAGQSQNGFIGESGFGYYRLTSGISAHKGYTKLGANATSVGMIEQVGGQLILNAGSVPAKGQVADYYDGFLSTGAGTGIFQLSGGVFQMNGRALHLGESSVGGGNNGVGILTMENDAYADIDYLVLANRNASPKAFVNLKGGTLYTKYLQKGGGNNINNQAAATVAFDGGTLKIKEQGNDASSLIRAGANNTPALLHVYAGGVKLEVEGLDGGISLSEPLSAPVNHGVASLAVTAPGAGYIAPPLVVFTGACLREATAFAEIDFESGEVTAIRVTNPGCGYAVAPTVVLQGGGGTQVATAVATLAPNLSGGLVKSGSGMLSLEAPNTFTGDTVIKDGILRLAAGDQPLAEGSQIVVDGGILDLAGSSLRSLKPVVLKEGSIINGTLQAGGIVKQGTGVATLGVAPHLASESAQYHAFVESLEPWVWYDPADAATVTLEDGRVTRLLNKGSKSGMDAGNDYKNGSADLIAPTLVSGEASYAASGRAMLKVDANNVGLASDSAIDITGSMLRTVVVVAARAGDGDAAVVTFGAGSEGKLFEIGDRKTAVVGCYGSGNDLAFSTADTPASADVYMGAVVGEKATAAWRTSVYPLEASRGTSATLNTQNSRFLLGQRAGTPNRTDFRGQVGEVMVFNRLLDETERRTLERFLVQKWFIPPAATGMSDDEAGRVQVQEGTLRLATSAASIAQLAPIVWYDPADEAALTVAAGRVTGIVNKGTRGAAMDAIVKSGFQGALLKSGEDSYAATGRAMLKIDSSTTGLESATTTGITGTAPRTLIAVFARDDAEGKQEVVVSFGGNSSRRLMELGDRANNIFGTHSDDLNMAPQWQAGHANVYCMVSSGARGVVGWRAGGVPSRVSKTMSGDWNTSDTPLCLGYRYGVHRTEFRGQVGEVLLFDYELSESQINTVQAFLVKKWMLPQMPEEMLDGTIFDVAENAVLDLNAAQHNITVMGNGSIINGRLGANFVISPAGDAAVGTMHLQNVLIPAGATYRVTLDETQSDCLYVDGDLSHLTLVPATSRPITGHSFMVASGHISALPTLDGFDQKFRLRLRGNDLFLTRLDGTLLLIR